jgi:YjjW family glycine radical enzyme activase
VTVPASSPPTGLTSGLLPFSLVDGPGARFVAFLQGCGFDCPACHNPYTIGVCDDCGACLDACDAGALSVLNGHVSWNPDLCLGGGACVQACPIDATPKTRRWTPAALVEQVRASTPFVSGVTVSGGEATRQAAFVAAFFGALADDPELGRLSRFVDSNGDADLATWRSLAPVMDAAMIDLKAFDDAVHRELTGRPVARVLDSIAWLADRALLHEVRMLLIPGRNDDDATIDRTAAWLARVAPGVPVKVIGFRRHGVREIARAWPEPSRERLEAVAARLRAGGVRETQVV